MGKSVATGLGQPTLTQGADQSVLGQWPLLGSYAQHRLRARYRRWAARPQRTLQRQAVVPLMLSR